MDLDRSKKELSNEYKIFEIQVVTSLQLSLTRYSTTLSITIYFIYMYIDIDTVSEKLSITSEHVRMIFRVDHNTIFQVKKRSIESV